MAIRILIKYKYYFKIFQSNSLSHYILVVSAMKSTLNVKGLGTGVNCDMQFIPISFSCICLEVSLPSDSIYQFYKILMINGNFLKQGSCVEASGKKFLTSNRNQVHAPISLLLTEIPMKIHCMRCYLTRKTKKVENFNKKWKCRADSTIGVSHRWRPVTLASLANVRIDSKNCTIGAKSEVTKLI